MKRSDLPTARVLRTVADHGFDAYAVLAQDFPEKVILAAFRRDVDRDLLDYGTWEGSPWLTPKGEEVLNG